MIVMTATKALNKTSLHRRWIRPSHKTIWVTFDLHRSSNPCDCTRVRMSELVLRKQ